jgi:hypothetical protein
MPLFETGREAQGESTHLLVRIDARDSLTISPRLKWIDGGLTSGSAFEFTLLPAVGLTTLTPPLSLCNAHQAHLIDGWGLTQSSPAIRYFLKLDFNSPKLID